MRFTFLRSKAVSRFVTIKISLQHWDKWHGKLTEIRCFGSQYTAFFLDFFSVQYMVRVIDATVHKHDIAAFQCHAIQNRSKWKSKPFSPLGSHVNAVSRKSLEIQAYSITKPRTLLKRKFVLKLVFSCSNSSWK